MCNIVNCSNVFVFWSVDEMFVVIFKIRVESVFFWNGMLGKLVLSLGVCYRDVWV